MSDEELKRMMQSAGFHNTVSPYEAVGSLEAFRRLVTMSTEAERDRCLRIIRNGCGDSVIEAGLTEAVVSGDYD